MNPIDQLWPPFIERHWNRGPAVLLEMPYGMHPARAHNFLVVVAGRTSVRVWPPATFKTNSVTWLHRTDYKSIVGRSRLLEGRPGDILYWSAGSWHVNEGYTRTMSVGLNILLFPE